MADVRTYGGWRRRRSLGLFGLGTTGTLILLGAIAVLILLGTLSPALVLYAGPPALAIGGLALVQFDGVPLGRTVLRHVRWWYGSARDYSTFQGGVVLAHLRAFQLPGVLAATRLLSAEDGYGRPYGIVWDRRTGYLTLTVQVVPTSMWLANRDEADGWVSNWGNWLASLGHVPTLRWVTVTVDTAPEPGSTLADSIARTTAPDAPAPATLLLGELVKTAPATAADVRTYLSLTFDPARSPAPPTDLTSAVMETSRTVEGLTSSLGGCGVTVAGRATASEISATVRAAFDPASRGEVSRTDLTWADAGPIHAQESADHYRHDSGTSVSWAWHDAPRQNVPADVLSRLVAPGPYAKRVSLQYRPLPAAQATQVLEEEVNAAAFREQYRRRTGRDESARDAFDQARARQAAAEEAMGAGVCLVTMYVTTTVIDSADLSEAIARTETAAETSRIRLRRLWGSQAAAFATTLPCGVCPAELSQRWK
ncbi:SCO6880 family protein [Nonomuraea sp. NPDC046570]|uniref:SCO6880 family protein n=1 Tax=Nonomuraea sp. NPDC046570 TaxID=3155255 RepID=UPI0033C3D248